MNELISSVVKDLIDTVRKENTMDADVQDFGWGIVQGLITAYTKVIQAAGYEIEFHHRENKCTSITIGTVAFPI